ncbi:MAG: hypothetical protein R3E79_19080 [Caldilineaceae bacterium]
MPGKLSSSPLPAEVAELAKLVHLALRAWHEDLQQEHPLASLRVVQRVQQRYDNWQKEEHPLAISTLAHRFGIAEMLESEKSLELLTALLYYLGVLTPAGRNERAELILRIPNLVIHRLYTEATTQLHDYRTTLTQKYEATLRLRTYTVVALGFERLVWEEV